MQGGLVIETATLADIGPLGPDSTTVTVGAGVRWSEVAEATIAPRQGAPSCCVGRLTCIAMFRRPVPVPTGSCAVGEGTVSLPGTAARP
ncbi:hypothetical protein [Streptomyces cyaneochromogenes]|uniref:hypothetical protein n=1 Tax=Streptomyces cyaneochromogenes TaxID=2496836 RepID=UPI002B1EAFBA|nr:hypothetical protein [Streptomyces cyaneochromogenes]